MPPNVYIVGSRMRLAEEWMYQNEKFLRGTLELEAKPKLISSDDWRDPYRLQGLPADSLVILVNFPFREFLRNIKQMYPHYVFISVDLD